MSRCEHQESSLGGFVKGIVIGGLIGAGIAALITPYTGEEARKQLKKKSKDIEKKARRFVEDVSDNLEENKENIQNKINAVSSVIEKKADHINAFLDDKNVQSAVSFGRKSLDDSRKALEEIWNKRLNRSKEEEQPKKETPVKHARDNSEVELARKILSRASGRSFYKKSPRK